MSSTFTEKQVVAVAASPSMMTVLTVIVVIIRSDLSHEWHIVVKERMCSEGSRKASNCCVVTTAKTERFVYYMTAHLNCKYMRILPTTSQRTCRSNARWTIAQAEGAPGQDFCTGKKGQKCWAICK